MLVALIIYIVGFLWLVTLYIAAGYDARDVIWKRVVAWPVMLPYVLVKRLVL
jgi:hypothetical protein